MWCSLRLLLASAILVLIADVAPAQFVRQTPDLKPPPGYVPGPGIDRNGIRSFPSVRQNRTFVLPGGGFYRGGFFPTGSYYFSRRTFYSGPAFVDPYYGGYWFNDPFFYRGPFVLPPVAGDAGALFGPRAAQNFLAGGGNNNVNNGIVANVPAARVNRVPVRAAAAAAPNLPPPASNPTARAQAWKFVEYGDRQFQKGSYRRAVERYQKAQSQAGDVAEIYFRLAFAELGLGQYSDAVAAMRQGLAIDPQWPDSGFVLEELYPGPQAKRAVFRKLIEHRNERPHDAEALFMLSVMQHFDGQEAAAEVGFRRVVELIGFAPHAEAFLPRAEQAEQPAPQPAPDKPAEQQPAPAEPLLPPPMIAAPQPN